MTWLGWVWAAVAVLPWVVWPLGWLVFEQCRDRTRARRAAREAWQWLHERARERGCALERPRTDRRGDVDVVVTRRVPVRG